MEISLNESIVLFDVDGTITEPRKIISNKMVKLLSTLSKRVDIGFLTGSDIEYVKQQLWPAFNNKNIRENSRIFTCNGTESYFVNSDCAYELISKVSMRDKLGNDNVNKIYKEILLLQADSIGDIISHNLSMTGHFFQDRGSTINWCPIGRNATHSEREKFVEFDKHSGFRTGLLKELKMSLSGVGLGSDIVTVKLGGDTSFDIFPTGWDKTYVFNHFADDTEIWFVGDRCKEDGNDYEIFNALKHTGRAFEVSGPEETEEVTFFNILRRFDK